MHELDALNAVSSAGRVDAITFEETAAGRSDILLAEDTAGGGHRWRLIDDQPWRRAYVITNAAWERCTKAD